MMIKKSFAPGRFFCPLPLYIIGTNNENGTPNFATVTWMASNWNGKPHIMVGLGAARQARHNVMRDGVFSLSLVSKDLVWLADHLGSAIGHDIYPDVEYAIGFGDEIQVPTIEDSPMVFECRVSRTFDMDGDAKAFIGDIENIQLAADVQDMHPREGLDLLALDPVLFAPDRYYGIGEDLGPCDGWSDHIEELRKLDPRHP